MGIIGCNMWDEAGRQTYRGVLDVKYVNRLMVRQGKQAASIMRNTGAAHVIYGMKMYSGDMLAAIHFYLWPMNDEEFYRVTGKVRNAYIYALHQHGR